MLLQRADVGVRILHGRKREFLCESANDILLYGILLGGDRLAFFRETRTIPHPRLLYEIRISQRDKKTKKVSKIPRDRMDVFPGSVCRRDRKNHLPETPNLAVVDPVHTGPAENRRANRCAEIAVVGIDAAADDTNW